MGTVEGKQSIIDAFAERHSSCSKKAIEKYLKEITVKERREPDERVCYYVTPEHWAELTTEQQATLTALNDSRMKPFREEALLQEQKRREELELKELQRKEKED